MPAAVDVVKSKAQNKKIVFDDEGSPTTTKMSKQRNSQKPHGKAKENGSRPIENFSKVVKNAAVDVPRSKPQNKKIVFGDEGGPATKKVSQKSDVKAKEKASGPRENGSKPVKNSSGSKEHDSKTSKTTPAVLSIDLTAKPACKKIIFDDDGEVVTEAARIMKKKKVRSEKESPMKAEDSEGQDDEDDFFAKREKQQQAKGHTDEEEAQNKWFNVFPQHTSGDTVLDLKENEQMELYNTCKAAFEAELPIFKKRNPADSRWLQTALFKGTAKDRANAGALLVTSNPLGNLEALSTLINSTKLSNKSATEVIVILNELWKEVLLPPHRKLMSLQMRGADWKALQKDADLSKERKRRIQAYWYFESELKEQYFEFLKNLQQGIQTGQENNKNSSIIAASQLLAYAPEKEQMLLTMLINKLGDPIAKVASKALHHLTEVAHKHPNMCGVIVNETEKLLFRNNISDRAQHFALCFLASIAAAGRAEVCTKLVHICFALFKVLVQRGAVNSRTMQAILRCLQKAILEAKPTDGSGEILTKDMQDTIYRLVHLADIRISVQTLGLLLQLVSVKTEKSDRFYNALYKKLLDMELPTIGGKTAAQLLHIIHRAIHIDGNVARAQAFIKRLLQISLYVPPHMAAGCLIVIGKLLRTRSELAEAVGEDTSATNKAISSAQDGTRLPQVAADDEELQKFDSEGEEKYADADEEESGNALVPDDSQTAAVASSWHHAKVQADDGGSKVKEISASKYDPLHRVPSFAGAEYALRNELLLLREHFHPTVQVFADNILNQKRIEYYGDPLRDFGLPHFLERFAFKNPKKVDNQKAELPAVAHKRYASFGSRGKPVKSLTKANCTEEEMFIFNFLEKKREQSAINQDKKSKSQQEEDEDDLELKAGEVNDDEFDEYLDGFFGKKKRAGTDEEAEKDDDVDFLKELGGDLGEGKKQKKNKKKSKADSDDDEGGEVDWGDDAEEDFAADNSDMSEDEAESNDELETDDDDGEDNELPFDNGSDSEMSEELSDEEGDDALPPKSKKPRKEQPVVDTRNFNRKLKHSDDMSSLFAAADDFAELLEETGKTKGQGTSNAVFNKDKSSDKQMRWEEKRHSNAKTYTKKHGQKSGSAGGKRKAFTKRR